MKFCFPIDGVARASTEKWSSTILTLAYRVSLFIDFCFNLRAVVTYKSHGFWCRFGLCQAGILNVFRLCQGPCPDPVPSMSRSCLTHVTVMVQSGCCRFLLLQQWFPVTMLSCLIMIRNPAVMPWSRAGHVLVVCRHAHDIYVAVLSCSCHLNIYSSPPGNFLCRMVCTVRSLRAWLARAKPSPGK